MTGGWRFAIPSSYRTGCYQYKHCTQVAKIAGRIVWYEHLMFPSGVQMPCLIKIEGNWMGDFNKLMGGRTQYKYLSWGQKVCLAQN